MLVAWLQDILLPTTLKIDFLIGLVYYTRTYNTHEENMAYASIDLSDYIADFDDQELIEELKSRGYDVEKEPEIISIEYLWNRGDRKEALIRLEREFPELRGISNLNV